jgi:hypothetical protein
MSTKNKIEETKAPPQANDHVEQRAAELAGQKGRREVSDTEREQAYDQLQKTAPPATKASH